MNLIQEMAAAMERLRPPPRAKMVIRLHPEYVRFCMETFGFVPTFEQLVELLKEDEQR